MQVDLFAGIPVRDYEEALAWYTRLLGSEPSFVPHAREAAWELAEHRFLFIVERPEHAGHGRTQSSSATSMRWSLRSPPAGSSLLRRRLTRTVSGKTPIETPMATRWA
jgi:catechol 2,3-dioxygenase-like lactoylglutathione lyase family enzyme